jgi:hypothetical protein
MDIKCETDALSKNGCLVSSQRKNKKQGKQCLRVNIYFFLLLHKSTCITYIATSPEENITSWMNGSSET